MTSPSLHLKVVLPSDPRYLPVVRGAISPLAAAIGWDESGCREITLALDEALANIIRHAYHGRPDGLIELECRGSDDGLEVTLLDHGDPPDKTRICARAIACDQPGGLGTHIIKDVMDTVSYQATPAGNRFVATKRLRKTI
ncbi:MAG: ATP-binding protein [Bryobacteraceae bacterium]|jgi:anti-sigma regulatory factor (Ser/Thr protein kinase)